MKSESEVTQSCLTLSDQASPSLGLSRQEYWSGLLLPSLFYPEPSLFSGEIQRDYKLALGEPKFKGPEGRKEA